MGDANFDKVLRMKKGEAQYRADKAKAGRAGSSAGKPRPYARHSIKIALLYSPKSVGRSFTVKPKEQYRAFSPSFLYQWKCLGDGEGEIEGFDVTADEIKEHFIVKRKGEHEHSH